MNKLFKLGIVLFSVLIISVFAIPTYISAASPAYNGKLVELSDADFWAKSIQVFGPEVKNAKRIIGQYKEVPYINSTPSNRSMTNWAGYENLNAGGTTIQGVIGFFTARQCTGTSAHDSEWVGLSNDYINNNLLQTGVNMLTMQAWWENLPGSEQDITNFNVSAGDVIHASVGFDYSGYYYVALYNATQNEVWGADKQFTPDINCCEWITECILGSHIGTFGTVNFSYCRWWDSSLTYHNMNYGTGLIYDITCTNPYNETMTPTSIGSDNQSFSITKN